MRRGGSLALPSQPFLIFFTFYEDLAILNFHDVVSSVADSETEVAVAG